MFSRASRRYTSASSRRASSESREKVAALEKANCDFWDSLAASDAGIAGL